MLSEEMLDFTDPFEKQIETFDKCSDLLWVYNSLRQTLDSVSEGTCGLADLRTILESTIEQTLSAHKRDPDNHKIEGHGMAPSLTREMITDLIVDPFYDPLACFLDSENQFCEAREERMRILYEKRHSMNEDGPIVDRKLACKAGVDIEMRFYWYMQKMYFLSVSHNELVRHEERSLYSTVDIVNAMADILRDLILLAKVKARDERAKTKSRDIDVNLRDEIEALDVAKLDWSSKCDEFKLKRVDISSKDSLLAEIDASRILLRHLITDHFEIHQDYSAYVKDMRDYARERNELQKEIAKAIDELEQEFSLQEVAVRLLQSGSLELIAEEHADADDGCPICLDELSTEKVISKVSCRHHFHTRCIAKWMEDHTSCPLCRHPLAVETPAVENAD